MLEEMIGLLFSGKTESRTLAWQEVRVVDAFKLLLAETMRERYIQLQFDASESRRNAARLQEEISVLKFIDAYDDEIRHPRDAAA